MYKRNWVLSAGLALVLVAALTAAASVEPNDQQRPLNFEGQVVLLIVDYSSALENRRSSEYLRDAVLQKIGDRFFITGEAFSVSATPEDAPTDWRKDSYVGIAWEKVQQFYVFSPDRMEEMIKARLEEFRD